MNHLLQEGVTGGLLLGEDREHLIRGVVGSGRELGSSMGVTVGLDTWEVSWFALMLRQECLLICLACIAQAYFIKELAWVHQDFLHDHPQVTNRFPFDLGSDVFLHKGRACLTGDPSCQVHDLVIVDVESIPRSYGHALGETSSGVGWRWWRGLSCCLSSLTALSRWRGASGRGSGVGDGVIDVVAGVGGHDCRLEKTVLVMIEGSVDMSARKRAVSERGALSELVVGEYFPLPPTSIYNFERTIARRFRNQPHKYFRVVVWWRRAASW
jgi:hypothetical protein